jgi:RNA polymerase sigma-70 factor, ECF subfamily
MLYSYLWNISFCSYLFKKLIPYFNWNICPVPAVSCIFIYWRHIREQLVLEEIQTLALVKAGNADAFSEIIKSYQKPVLRYITRLTGDCEISQDLTQETFLQAYKGISKLNSDIAFKTWLYRIATNNTMQYLRRKKLFSVILFTHLKRSTISDNENGLDRTFESMDVKEALLKIPQDQRVCLTLHYIEGFQYREIAQTLGTSEEAVRKRVARGISRLKIIFASEAGDRI